MTASTVTYHHVNRARTVSIVSRIGVRGDRVAGATTGVDQFRAVTVIDFPAQALDVDLDEIRHRIEAVVPDMLGDVGAAHDLALPTHEILEQRVLLRRELDLLSVPLDAMGARVDGQVLDGQ